MVQGELETQGRPEPRPGSGAKPSRVQLCEPNPSQQEGPRTWQIAEVLRFYYTEETRPIPSALLWDPGLADAPQRHCPEAALRLSPGPDFPFTEFCDLLFLGLFPCFNGVHPPVASREWVQGRSIS